MFPSENSKRSKPQFRQSHNLECVKQTQKNKHFDFRDFKMSENGETIKTEDTENDKR